MNISKRISLNVNKENADKYIKIRLEQDVSQHKFLPLNINTKDAYRNFNADYGVLVGRVMANESIGIPNAKISIFIPLADEDANDSEIVSIYPYKTPRDKNSEGKRYNLLPRVAKKNPKTGIISPKQPFGSFPVKEELLTNINFLRVYKKYYRYTATTNEYGDYMIFGVPVGTQIVHMSVDITDIGKYSMTPASMVVNLGYSPNLFIENNTKIKPSSDLNDLPHIETQEISVDIIPFWGDKENFEIGITRQDFRIRSTLVNQFVIFGSAFTDSDQNQWGTVDTNNDNDKVFLLYTMSTKEDIGIGTKRPAKVIEKIYYYPDTVSDSEILSPNSFDKMVLLDKSEYSVYKRDGDFVFIINCNRKRMVMNEQGELIPADNSTKGGIFTEFKGFITLEVDETSLPLNWIRHGEHVYIKPIREKLKFPQTAQMGATFRRETNYYSDGDSDNWRSQYFTFCGGGIYSLARFHALAGNVKSGYDANETHIYINGHCYEGFIEGTEINNPQFPEPTRNVGIIQTNDFLYTGNTAMGMRSSVCMTYQGGTMKLFGGSWLNLSVYLPQIGWACNNYSYIKCHRVNSHISYADKSDYYMKPNNQKIAGTYTDTCSFARSDLNWTDIICVPKIDIINMYSNPEKGFRKSDLVLTGTTYRNNTYVPPSDHPIYWCGAAPLRKCTNETDTFFFKGIEPSDAIKFLIDLGIV